MAHELDDAHRTPEALLANRIRAGDRSAPDEGCRDVPDGCDHSGREIRLAPAGATVTIGRSDEDGRAIPVGRDGIDPDPRQPMAKHEDVNRGDLVAGAIRGSLRAGDAGASGALRLRRHYRAPSRLSDAGDQFGLVRRHVDCLQSTAQRCGLRA